MHDLIRFAEKAQKMTSNNNMQQQQKRYNSFTQCRPVHNTLNPFVFVIIIKINAKMRLRFGLPC